MTQEEKFEEAKRLYETANADQRYVLESLFPELRESEDERIRKELIEALKQLDREKCPVDTYHYQDWIDWLEKQAQKPTDKVEPKFKVGDTMRTLQEANDGYTDGMPVVVSIDEEYYHCNNELIAIKDQDDYEYPPMNRRQKPAEWGEEDEVGLGNAMWAIKQAKTIAKDENDMGNLWYAENWLKSLKERAQPQKSGSRVNCI